MIPLAREPNGGAGRFGLDTSRRLTKICERYPQEIASIPRVDRSDVLCFGGVFLINPDCYNCVCSVCTGQFCSHNSAC